MMTLETISDHSIHCWAWNRVYIKSNGRIPCWCDTGETHTIIKHDHTKNDFITDIVNSAEMRHMRLTIIRDNQSYIEQCQSCCYLLTQGERKHKRYSDSPLDITVSNKSAKAMQEMIKTANQRGWPLGSIDKIKEMQLEPSFPCNLKCAGCLHGVHPDSMSTEEMPYLMPYEMLVSMIDSIVTHAVKLERIAFVGRGEPTLNKRFPDMISYIRQALPNVIMSMDTNSTQAFKEDYLLLNWINCSIDGSEKSAYDTYRRNGNYDAAIKFLSEAAASKRILKRACKVRWKYILFNTTEHLHLLNKAQQMALDFGIDELDFVITAAGAADGTVTPPIVMNTVTKMQSYLNENKIFPSVVVSRS